MYPKKLLYFHTISLNLFKRIMVLIFIVELHFSSMTTYLINVVQRELLIMMFSIHQALVMIEFTHIVGFLNWKNGMFIITGVQMSYDPTDNSYSSLKQLSVIFVIKIVFLQQILFCIKNVYIYVSHCLLVPFVFYLYTHSCLQMHITEAHGGPRTAISFL